MRWPRATSISSSNCNLTLGSEGYRTLHLFIIGITGIYPFDEGGPALALYGMLKGIVEACRLNSEIEMELLIGMSDPECLNLDRHTLLNLPMVSVLRNLRSVTGFRTTINGCSNFAGKITNADIIFYNAAPTDLITITYPFTARMARKKQIYYLHGSLVNENVDSKSRKYFHSIARLGFFDRVIVPLKSFKNYVSKLICPYEIISTIPECVVTPWYEDPHEILLEGDPSILYAGRLAQVKRVDILLKAFSTITSQYPSAKLYLAGSGPLESFLKELCTKLGISKKVVFLGHVQHDKLRVLYRSSDIFVLPSDAELMSLSVLEAMASKCTVIASDIAAIEVIQNGQNGLIFSRGDFKMLANNISILADDEAFRKYLSDKAYLTIKKRFDYRVVASQLLEEMRNILIDSGSRKEGQGFMK